MCLPGVPEETADSAMVMSVTGIGGGGGLSYSPKKIKYQYLSMIYREITSIGYSILPPPPWPGLSMLVSTLLFCQPSELIWAFFLFHKLSHFTPRPPIRPSLCLNYP